MEFDYSRLRGKIREMGVTQSVLGRGIKMRASTLSQKLNNKSNFTQTEILAMCDILRIAPWEVQSYFFRTKV